MLYNVHITQRGCDIEGGESVVKNKAAKQKGTFIVKILDRQNATWQGTVTWTDEQQVQNFRSALELLRLIDGALNEQEADQY
jgi:hypothetical protein